MRTQPSKRRGIRLGRVLAAGGVLALLVAAGAFLALPKLLRTMVADALATDAAQDVQIEDVRFNPLTGRGSLKSLRIKTPSGAELSIGLAEFDLDVSELWRQRVLVEELRIEDARFEIERTGGGWQLAGWGPLQDAKAKPRASRWIVGVDKLEARRTSLRYRDGAASLHAEFEDLRLSDFVPWRPLTVSAFDLKAVLDEGRIAAKGTMTPFAKAQRATADVRLASLRLDSLAPVMGLDDVPVLKGAASAELRTEVKRAADGSLEGSVSGSTSLGEFEATVAGMSVGLGRARWAGDVKFSAGGRQKPRAAPGKSGTDPAAAGGGDTPRLVLHLDGAFSTENARLERPHPAGPQRMTVESVTFDDLRGEAAVTPAGGIRAAVTLKASARALQSEDPEFGAAGEAIEWNGAVAYHDGEDGGIGASYDGRAQLTGLKIDWRPAGFELRQDAGAWEGKLAYMRPSASEPVAISMEADVQATGMQLASKRLGQRVIGMGALEFKRAKIGPDAALAIGEATIADFSAFQAQGDGADDTRRSPRPAVALKKLLVERIEMPSPARVLAQRVTVDGSTSRLVRNADGRFELFGSILTLMKQLDTDRGGKRPQDRAGAADAPGLTFSIGETVIGGGSRLVFEDRSVNPPVRLAAASFSAQMGTIDSAEPGRDSPFSLSAKFGGYGQMAVKGTIRPFAPQLTLEADGQLKSFDLPAISSYLSGNLGYTLTRGRLDADIRLGVSAGELRADSKLVLSKLQVEITNTKEAEPLRARLEVPLEKALSLLRDSDDTIRLSIPVSGDVDNPRFDFSDAINQAVGKAIRNAMLTTLKFAIPIVGLISILDDAGEEKLQFKSVAFDPGSSTLGPASLTYLGDLARLLAERPSLTLSVCGRATDSDKEFLLKAADSQPASGAPPPAAPGRGAPSPSQPPAAQPSAEVTAEQLMRLASRRARAVKDHLVDSHSVSHERVFTCAPRIDEGNAAPRVEILM